MRRGPVGGAAGWAWLGGRGPAGPLTSCCCVPADYDAVGEEGGAGAAGSRSAGGERAAAEHGGRPAGDNAAAGEEVPGEGPAGGRSHVTFTHTS